MIFIKKISLFFILLHLDHILYLWSLLHNSGMISMQPLR